MAHQRQRNLFAVAPTRSLSQNGVLLRAILLFVAIVLFIAHISLIWKVLHDSKGSGISDIPQLAQATATSSLAVLPEDNNSFSFSACLLIRDDNRILPEWLAYHFTVMPLRHLIVGVDPFSTTSPEPILDKFRDLGMSITIWEDKDFNDLPPPALNDSMHNKFYAYILRQRLFYQKCLIEFNNRGSHTWTLLIDTDEYIVFNNYFETEMTPNIHKHGDPRAKLPAIGDMTVAQYIANNHEKNRSWEKFPCINIPRILFGNKESTAEEIASQVPIGFDPVSFSTMRFRFHQDPTNNRFPGKSIVDASRHDGSLIKSIHNVMGDACSPPHAEPPYTLSVLRVQHYTGPLDFFLRIGQDERSKEIFSRRNAFTNESSTDDATRGWLQVFVSIVGKSKAFEMTESLREWAITNHAKVAAELALGNFTYPFHS